MKCVSLWQDVSFMVCLMVCERMLWCLDTCSSQTQHWLFFASIQIHREKDTHMHTHAPRCPSKTTTASCSKFEPLCPNCYTPTYTQLFVFCIVYFTSHIPPLTSHGSDCCLPLHRHINTNSHTPCMHIYSYVWASPSHRYQCFQVGICSPEILMWH